jgi:hypothetical protein
MLTAEKLREIVKKDVETYKKNKGVCFPCPLNITYFQPILEKVAKDLIKLQIETFQLNVEHFYKSTFVIPFLSLPDQCREQVDDFEKGYKEQIPAYKDFYRELADEFIFLPLDFPMSTFFDELEKSKKSYDENKELFKRGVLEDIKSKSDEICGELVKNFTHRKNILEAAFEAHNNGKYELSIPVMMSQADGITWDRMGKALASNRRDVVDRVKKSDDINAALVDCFFSNETLLPVLYNEKRRECNNYTGINRHSILHGEKTDYPTEENSLKTISFLKFIDYAIPELQIDDKSK